MEGTKWCLSARWGVLRGDEGVCRGGRRKWRGNNLVFDDAKYSRDYKTSQETNEVVYLLVRNPPIASGDVGEGLVVVGVPRSTAENKPSSNRCHE
jgi:hypothetical protein